jgi:hypothetical protein
MVMTYDGTKEHCIFLDGFVQRGVAGMGITGSKVYGATALHSLRYKGSLL